MKLKRYKGDINPVNGRFEVPLIFNGRTYKLWKKEQTTEAHWYLRVTRKGTDIWRCMETNDADAARTKAPGFLDIIFNGDQAALDASRLRDPLKYATVAQVCALYEQLAKVVRPRDGIRSLCCLLRKVFGEAVNVLALTVDTLTGKVVRDFQACAVKSVRAQNLNTAEYRAALNRAQYSANSSWTQARALFLPALMAQYRDAGLVFPVAFETDFVAAPKILGVKTAMYVQPGDTLIRRTLEGHRRMMDRAMRSGFGVWVDGNGRDRGPDFAARRSEMAVMIALELGAGLRRGEVLAARAAWFGEVNGHWCVTLPGNATKNKNGSNERLPAEFEQFIKAYLAARKLGPNARLISGSVTVACVSRWMRLLGWTGSKTHHALRKYFGYRVAVQHGIAVAQRKLRHARIATTQNFYTGILNGDDVVVSYQAPAPGQVVPLPKAAEG